MHSYARNFPLFLGLWVLIDCRADCESTRTTIGACTVWFISHFSALNIANSSAVNIVFAPFNL